MSHTTPDVRPTRPTDPQRFFQYLLERGTPPVVAVILWRRRYGPRPGTTPRSRRPRYPETLLGGAEGGGGDTTPAPLTSEQLKREIESLDADLRSMSVPLTEPSFASLHEHETPHASLWDEIRTFLAENETAVKSGGAVVWRVGNTTPS